MVSSDLQLPMPIEELRAILRKNGVRTASVFGSYARGQATTKSDLDLLVELADGKSYLDLGGLQYELQEHYAVKADIATHLNRHFEPYITPSLSVSCNMNSPKPNLSFILDTLVTIRKHTPKRQRGFYGGSKRTRRNAYASSRYWQAAITHSR